mmetsp:Transcript_27244/g.36417  ORF Transcript_27244/g.36417 Transcript_27244/m.36417 type:complete len:82 (+) Transcript_27244:3611-3856(+)
MRAYRLVLSDVALIQILDHLLLRNGRVLMAGINVLAPTSFEALCAPRSLQLVHVAFNSRLLKQIRAWLLFVLVALITFLCR